MMRPVTVAPSRMASGRIGDADLDLVRPGSGVGLGRDFPHAAGGLHLRVVGQRDLDQRVARACPDQLFGHVEHGVASTVTRDLGDHPPGTDHFARFGADRGDRTGGIGEKNRVAQLLLRDAHLCPGGVGLGLSVSKLCWALSNLARDVQPLFNSSCSRHKVICASFSWASTEREVGLRRAQRALLDLRVEPSDDLAGQHIAHIDGAVDHASVEAEGEAGLVLGADLTGQRDDLAPGTLLHGHRSDGPGLQRQAAPVGRSP